MTQQSYKFDEFELDVPKRQLTRRGDVVPLNPKAFDLLFVLVENSGRLLSKEDLFTQVWEDQIVEESNLTVNMSAIRKALGEKASEPRFIATVSGRGYRFVGDVIESNRRAEETVIESRTLERIIVEEETETDDERPTPAQIALPAVSEGIFTRRNVLIGAVLAAVVVAGIVVSFLVRGATGTSVQPKIVSMKRLTNLGNVTNAALSPDGKLFAYTLQEKDGRRSFWLGHVDGGGENINLRPASDVTFHGIAFARDGSHVYYIVTSDEFEQGSLFRIKIFGGVPELVRENVGVFITFSPDGKEFAFVRADVSNKRSSLMAAETGQPVEREIASRSNDLPFLSGSPSWSPDGKQIAVSAISDRNANESEIYTVSVDDGTVKPVTQLGWTDIRALVWAYDGRSLFSVAGEKGSVWESQLWRISYPEGTANRLVSDLNVYGAALGVAPTGKELLVFQAQHYSNIWVAPAENLAAAKQITFELLGKKNGWDALDWVGNDQITYTAFNAVSESIWSMDANGKNARQIVPDGGTNSRHSFDAEGSMMVFNSNRNGAMEIWAANPDGSRMSQITTGGNNSQPHISPDGASIVFRSVRDGVGTLRKISSTGGETTKFTENSSSWPRYSPDGKFIACVYRSESKTRIAVLNAVDGQAVKYFDYPVSANFNNGLRWTPGGKGLTYRDWNNGIWLQNIDGGEPMRIPGLPEEKLYSYGWSRDGKQFAFTRGTEIRDVVLIGGIK